MKADDANAQRNLDALLSEAAPEEQTDFRTIWQLTGSVPEPGAIDRAAEERVWQSLDALTQASSDPMPDRAPLRRVVRHRTWMAVAATLLIGAVGIALWLRPISRMALPGERLTVLLPDGSSVELNGGTTIRYARHFGVVRTVHLEGEAFFDVAAESRPFRVETFNATIEVLGTEFNVKAWPGGVKPQTRVALASGRVTLAASDRPEQAVAMSPGETRSVGAAAELSPPDTMALQGALAWRSGALLYHDEWLGVVLEDLERRFAVQLTLQAPALQQRRVNYSKHDPTDVEAVIHDLCASTALNYRATSTGYELYDPGM